MSEKTPRGAGRTHDHDQDEWTATLDALADAVLNGDAVDWPAAEARVAHDPGKRDLVRQLAILARAGRGSGAVVTPPPTSTPSTPPRATPTPSAPAPSASTAPPSDAVSTPHAVRATARDFASTMLDAPADTAAGTAADARDIASQTDIAPQTDATPRAAILPRTDATPWQHLLIQEEIGRGSFGVVYRAWDSRLQREVALKLLTPHQRGSLSPTVASALVHEGRLLASVRHPHVVTVYDAARHGETIGVWMELVRGRTLADIVRRDGPFGPHETIAIGVALCGALAAMHRADLLHQDIKADNVMRERGGRIVLMDFGAAAVASAPPGSLARGGFGSPRYLAPEILIGGAPSSPLSDLYSLGVLLFFLVTGTFPVTGDDLDGLREAHRQGRRRLLRDVRPDVPLPLATAIDRCLAADPSARFASVGALEQALDANAPAPAPIERRPWLPATVVAAGAAAALLWLWTATRDAPARVNAAAQPVTFELTVPGAASIEALAVSPAGRALAIVAQDAAGETALWLRRAESTAVLRLAGTRGASHPFWSPDDAAIGFFAEGLLKKISTAGGGVQTLCAAPDGRGGTWNRDGEILFAPTSTGALYRVSAAGGAARPVTALDRESQQHSHRYPLFLADGRQFLFLGMSLAVERRGLFLASLDRSDAPRRLLSADSNAALLGTRDLVLARDRTLIAQPIDPSRLTLAGETRPLANNLAFLDSRRAGVFSASSAGTLAWWAHPSPRVRLTWRDRAGTTRETREIDGIVYNLSLSPDNRRVALERIDPAAGTDDIWLLDRDRASLTRLTADPANDTDPVWAPDSQSLVFASNRGGATYQLYRQRIDHGGPPDRLTHGDRPTFAEDWSPLRGDLIVVQGREGERQLRRLALPVASRTPDAAVASAPPSAGTTASPAETTLVEDSFLKDEPHESPDGRFVAYHSLESGRAEVYVLALDDSAQRWQVSLDGGVQARWSARGDELFFLGLDGVLQVSHRTDATGWQRPRPLFQTGLRPSLTLEQYAVSRDGQQFLFALPVIAPAGPITVKLHAAR